MGGKNTGKRTHRRDRVARWFLLVVALMVVVGLLAPAIIGRTPLRDAALAGLLPPEAGRLTATDASLGWFSPTRLLGVRLTAPDGRVVMHADAVTLDRSVWQLAANSQDLGTIRVDRPALYVAVGPSGSSLEELLAAMQSGGGGNQNGGGGASAPTAIHLVIAGGSVAVTDTVTGVTQVHDPIDAEAVINGGLVSAQLTGSAHAIEIPPGGAAPVLPLAGPMNRRGGAITASLAPNSAGATEAKFKVIGFNPSSLTPWLRRFDASLELAGQIDGEGSAAWWPQPQGPPLQIATSGHVIGRALSVASNQIGGDPVPLGDVDIPWQLSTAQDGRLQINQLGVTSGFATGTVSGALTPQETQAVLAGDWSAPSSLQATADVDLARLARLAPEGLHLRQGVALASGRVRVQGAVQPEGAGRRVRATIETADLVAQANGRPVRWEKPIQVQLDASQQPTGLTLTRLACQSSFLNGSFAGDLSDLRGTVDLDLDKFVSEAKQLFDLGPWRLSGKAGGGFRLARAAAEGFDASGKVDVTGCVVTYSEMPIVQERQLVVDFKAGGKTDPATGRPIALSTAELGVVAGGDRLDARLTEPTAVAATDYPVDLRLVGDVRAWLRRANFLLASPSSGGPLSGVTAAGSVDARLQGRVGAERAALTNNNIVFTSLTATTPSLSITEPKVQFTGDLAWDAASGGVVSQAGQLVSSTVAMQARGLSWRNNAATGELAVRADLARLSAAAPGLLGTTRLNGQVTGGVRLVGQPGGPAAEVDLTAQPFTVAEAAPGGQRTLWQEPVLRVRGALAHAATDDRLTLTNLTLQSNDLSATASGRIDQLSTNPSPAVTATIDYDLAELTPLLAPTLGPGVQLVGRHQATIELATALATDAAGATPPHWSRQWTGRLSAPWTSASLYGLPVGSGTLKATLGGGVLQCEPIAVAIGQGRLTAQPAVRFDPAPAEWGLPAGQLIEGVRISPEVSDRMLKFIAPLLADATRSEGTFSLRTEGARAPIADASAMQTTGQLTVRELRVTPGPGVSNWVSIGRQVEALAKNRDPAALASRPTPTLLSIAERTINFQVTGQRVYHEGLTFDVDGVPVTSSGSVGFDETLQLTLSVPIQDRWIEKDRRLVGLQGQVLQVPIRGTLSQPRVNDRALRRLSRELIQKGVEGAIQSDLGRALEKLFD
ncbi:MAG: hypothetical protein AAF589_01735 [Planctomycetota bacterium]